MNMEDYTGEVYKGVTIAVLGDVVGNITAYVPQGPKYLSNGYGSLELARQAIDSHTKLNTQLHNLLAQYMNTTNVEEAECLRELAVAELAKRYPTWHVARTRFNDLVYAFTAVENDTTDFVENLRKGYEHGQA